MFQRRAFSYWLLKLPFRRDTTSPLEGIEFDYVNITDRPVMGRPVSQWLSMAFLENQQTESADPFRGHKACEARFSL